MNIRTFAKVLILTTRVCLPLVLRNNLSFNAYNFGLARDENAGTKTIKYLHFDWSTFWWCNLCIFWINGNNLKTLNSKMVFNTDIFMFLFEWLKRDWRPYDCCLHSKFFYLSTLPRITSPLAVNFMWCIARFDTICTI